MSCRFVPKPSADRAIIPSRYRLKICLWFGKLPFDVAHQIFQPVKFELIDKLQLATQRAFGKSFAMVPNHVMLGQVNQQASFIFAKRHFGVGKLDEEFAVGHGLNLKFGDGHLPRVGICRTGSERVFIGNNDE